MTADALVEIEDLSRRLRHRRPGRARPARTSACDRPAAQSSGIVGESGSGKSTLALALLGLLPANTTALSGPHRL